MRMGQQDKINVSGVYRQLLIDKNVLSLLHAAVHKALFIPGLNKRAAACNLMRRSEKSYLHARPILSSKVFRL